MSSATTNNADDARRPRHRASAIDRLVASEVLAQPLVYVHLLLLTPLLVVIDKGLAPIILGRLIQAVSNAGGPPAIVWRHIWHLALVFAGVFVLHSANYVCIMRIRTNMLTGMRNRLLASVMPGYRHSFYRDTVGDTLIKLYKVPPAADDAYSLSREIAINGITAVVVTAIVFRLNRRAGMIFAAVTVMLAALATGSFFSCQPKCQRSDGEQDALHENASELLNNMLTMYVTNTTVPMARALESQQRTFASLYTHCWFCGLAFKVALEFLFIVFIIATLVVCVRENRRGVLPAASLVAIVVILTKIHAPLVNTVHTMLKFNMVYARLQTSNALLDRLDRLRNAARDRRDQSLDGRPANIRIIGVRVRFALDGDRVLRLPDVAVPFGARLLITGEIGVGKSTLARLLAGLQQYDGSVTIGGLEVATLSADALHSLCTYVPQHPTLLAGSVYQNVVLGVPEPRPSPEDVAVHIAALGVHLPPLTQAVGNGGSAVSGGQCYIISLLRALLMPTPILILDEPTGSLDPMTAARVIEHINERVVQRTVIVITHHDAGDWRRDAELVIRA